MDDEARYWRTDEGHAEFDRLVESGAGRLFGRAPAASFGEWPFARILRFDGWPETGLSTYLTSGVGHFLLVDPDAAHGFSRIDLCWTVAEDTDASIICAGLAGLADHILGERHVPDLDVPLVRLGDLGIGEDCVRQHLMLATTHWLPEDARVDSYYPLRFLEMIALTDFESALLSRDIDRFFSHMDSRGQLATDLYAGG